MKQKITINDVAKRCGVARSTVSKALNNRASQINDKTRRKILKIAEEMKFTPNALARNLSWQKTQTIGFIQKAVFNPTTNPVYSVVFMNAALECIRHDYNILFEAISLNEEKWDGRLPKIARNRSADGILLCGNFPAEVIKSIAHTGIETVLLDNQDPSGSLPAIHYDNITGAQIAVRHLLSLKHKRIGFLSGPREDSSFSARFKGYKQALLEDGIRYKKEFVSFIKASDWTPSRTDDAFNREFSRLLTLRPGLTAVFCAYDEMALSFIDFLKKNGLRVPQDISVIGFDDADFAAHTRPALTTIRVDRQELGRLGVQLLLERIQKKNSAVKNTTLPSELVIRESTAAIKRK